MNPHDTPNLNELRERLQLPQIAENPSDSWLTTTILGDRLAQARYSESHLAFLAPDKREELIHKLAKSDAGPDAALVRIGRVLDTVGAWCGELLEPTMVLGKAVELRRKHTQKRWVLTLQRLCDPTEPVDATTRGIALKGLLQTDDIEIVESILKHGPFIHEYGIRRRHMAELGLSPAMSEFLVSRCPDLAAETTLET